MNGKDLVSGAAATLVGVGVGATLGYFAGPACATAATDTTRCGPPWNARLGGIAGGIAGLFASVRRRRSGGGRRWTRRRGHAAEGAGGTGIDDRHPAAGRLNVTPCVCGESFDDGDVVAETKHEWCRFESSAPEAPPTDPAPPPDQVSTWPAPAQLAEDWRTGVLGLRHPSFRWSDPPRDLFVDLGLE